MPQLSAWSRTSLTIHRHYMHRASRLRCVEESRDSYTTSEFRSPLEQCFSRALGSAPARTAPPDLNLITIPHFKPGRGGIQTPMWSETHAVLPRITMSSTWYFLQESKEYQTSSSAFLYLELDGNGRWVLTLTRELVCVESILLEMDQEDISHPRDIGTIIDAFRNISTNHSGLQMP